MKSRVLFPSNLVRKDSIGRMEALSSLQAWLKATTPSFQNLGNIKIRFPELETT